MLILDFSFVTSIQDLLAVLLWTCGKAVTMAKAKALTSRSGRMGEEGREETPSIPFGFTGAVTQGYPTGPQLLKAPPTPSCTVLPIKHFACEPLRTAQSMQVQLLLWLHETKRLAGPSLGESPRKIVHKGIQG